MVFERIDNMERPAFFKEEILPLISKMDLLLSSSPKGKEALALVDELHEAIKVAVIRGRSIDNIQGDECSGCGGDTVTIYPIEYISKDSDGTISLWCKPCWTGE